MEPLQFVVVLVELPTPVRVNSMAPPAWYIHMLIKSKYLLHIKAASCFIQRLHVQLHTEYVAMHKYTKSSFIVYLLPPECQSSSPKCAAVWRKK